MYGHLRGYPPTLERVTRTSYNRYYNLLRSEMDNYKGINFVNLLVIQTNSNDLGETIIIALLYHTGAAELH